MHCTPQGKYSENNLRIAKEKDYKTFFWSLAYVDWNVNDQPSREETLEKLIKQVHPEAIVLLHVTSKTNGEILDELKIMMQSPVGRRFMSRCPL